VVAPRGQRAGGRFHSCGFSPASTSLDLVVQVDEGEHCGQRQDPDDGRAQA
jgi:hypothetical protein